MVSQEIRTNAAALGVLMHQVTPEQAAMIRLVKTNLAAAADHAEELERGLVVPAPDFSTVKADAQVDEAKRQRIFDGVLVSLRNLLPPDCTGECDGCSHAKHEGRI